MSVLTAAGAGHLSRLLPLVAAFHQTRGITSNDARRRAALEPLLRGTPLGQVWMIGRWAAPSGYVAVSHGWSIEMGGPDALIDEFFIRDDERGRGMGTQALEALAGELVVRGLTALHMDPPQEADAFYARHGFVRRAGHRMLTRRL